jgi:hypothetical protein
VYTACLFCRRDLGRNDEVDAFPVGKRLAFDARRGRLWVVCAHCERWNLTPLEERWEAIDQCERLFRGTRLRASTDNIGLARIGEDLVLIRIGNPLRPEFAAWRYGDQFGRRRRQQIAVASGALVGVGAAAAVAGPAAIVGIAAGAIAWGTGALDLGKTWIRLALNPDQIIARIPGNGGDRVRVRWADLPGVRIWGDGDRLHMRLRRDAEVYEYSDEAAWRVAALLLPQLSRFGAGRTAVREAVEMIERTGHPRTYLGAFRPQGRESGRWGVTHWPRDQDRYGLFALPPSELVALEMAVHEEQERRALDGELAELEAAWREAEEIAAIADTLLTGPPPDASPRRLRTTGGA